MENMTLPLIGFPDEHTRYVRNREPDVEKVRRFTMLIADHKDWPFPPVRVMRLTEEMNKTAWKKGRRVIIVDGVARVLAARSSGLKTVPVNAVAPMNDAEYLAEQVKHNSAHGENLTMPERNKAIAELMGKFKWSVHKIGPIFGLSGASISRILRGIQAKGTRKEAAKKRSKKGSRGRVTEQAPAHAPKPAGPPVFSVQAWYEQVTDCLRSYKKHAESILKAKPLAVAVVEALAEMVLDLRTHAQPAKAAQNAKG